MKVGDGSVRWLRRARPLLGTLVEVGFAVGVSKGADTFNSISARNTPNGFSAGDPERAVQAAFDAIADVQRCLSVFDSDSDLARFHRLAAGHSLVVRAHTAQVLAAASRLQMETAGLFDISLGSSPNGWALHGTSLHKLAATTRLDLGGIGKGYAVDEAVAALQRLGCGAGWVNAGGDLRVFGDVELPIELRDETGGGTRPFGTLSDGAFATSHFGPGSRSKASARRAVSHGGVRGHASVAAPSCLWADALTKVVAISARADHPCLAAHGAHGWLH